jgi:hypothetical protein
MPKNAVQFRPSYIASFGKKFRKSAYREGIRLNDFASDFFTMRQCCMFAKGRWRYRAQLSELAADIYSVRGEASGVLSVPDNTLGRFSAVEHADISELLRAKVAMRGRIIIGESDSDILPSLLDRDGVHGASSTMRHNGVSGFMQAGEITLRRGFPRSTRPSPVPFQHYRLRMT